MSNFVKKLLKINLKIFLSLLFIFATTTVFSQSTTTHSETSVEQHHSLFRPFDSSLVHQKFGGQTVLTDKFVRLTPGTPSTSGWLWNDQSILSNNFEIEIEFEVGAGGNLGGDGFAAQILDGSHPFDAKRDLNGPIFGMSDTFKGFGIIFDTYDNDANDDNPLVYVLKNMEGNRFQYDNSKDFENDMLKTSLGNLPHKCSWMIRNNGKKRVLIRFVNDVLFVYTNSNPTSASRLQEEFQMCLAVFVGQHFNRTSQLVLTAHTGQISDTHDILSITTKYLKSDTSSSTGSGSSNTNIYFNEAQNLGGSFMRFYWLFVIIVSIGLLLETLYEVSWIRSLKSDKINPVYLCQKINSQIPLHYFCDLALFTSLFIFGTWFLVLLMCPLACLRLFNQISNKHLIEPSQFDSHGNSTYITLLYASLFVYALTAFICVFRLSSIL